MIERGAGGDGEQVGLLRDPEFRRAAILTFGIWLLVLGGHYVTELIAGRTGFVAEMALDVPAVLVVAALVLTAWPLMRRLAGVSPVARWTALALAVFAISFAQSLVNLAENLMLGVVPSLDAAHHDLIRDRFAANFQGHLYLTFANIVLLAFQAQLTRAAGARVELAEARAAADRERLVALRLQLNPHFLFNALNAVSSLVVVGRGGEAEAMLERLTDFLRLSLAGGAGEGMVSLGDELETAEAYLAIEQVRFPERLAIEVDVDDTLLDRRLPGFLLQPLIENAVKYGVARTARQVTVTIAAEAEGDRLHLSVSDDGDGSAIARRPGEGLGVGLGNVSERLAVLYHGRASLAAGPGEGGRGWRVALVLPAR